MYLKEKLLEYKAELEAKKANVNHAPRVITKIKTSIARILTQSVTKANESTSIDEKLLLLKDGAQEVLDYIVEYEDTTQIQLTEINSKLEIIEELIVECSDFEDIE